MGIHIFPEIVSGVNIIQAVTYKNTRKRFFNLNLNCNEKFLFEMDKNG